MVQVKVEKVWIDVYPEASREALPMFAENRVHQRTSGNPYPNKVVQVAQREVREKREYTCIILENAYLEIGILPDLGGKIWYAKDKKNGYDFFYKNNVIKPALIGVLGSWTSGGLEFNWPFHHRASTFMPVDYFIVQKEDYAIVWLSEHDPINRMKGMVGISLKDGECIFETKVKVDNITPFRHSFLWWENAAVPVDESYRIFFPPDVNYVRFHYKRSVTTYPIANNDRFGAFNGIYYDGDTDISQHKNTRQATSYFSAESKYDYFGGYNQNKQAGVVHIADHHISPGKKMFTWAYSQLAKTWENALTDNDGQYAELMAGCYSDNQPDLTWLMPNETKTFSQEWFPIHDNGIPVLANRNGALFVDADNRLLLQSVRRAKDVKIVIFDGENIVCTENRTLDCYNTETLCSDFAKQGMRVLITQGCTVLFDYTVQTEKSREIPEPRKELPYFKEVKTAQELYLEGLHIEQYRSPEYSAEECYKESLERESDYAPSAIALAELLLKKYDAKGALAYAEIAEKSATRFNTRLESGKIYYLKGLALCALNNICDGYDYLQKAAWSYDYRSAAMLHIGLLDIRRKEYEKAILHLQESLQGNAKSVVAAAFCGYAYYLCGDKKAAKEWFEKGLETDSLNHYIRIFQALMDEKYEAFYTFLQTDASQVSLDFVEVLAEAGLYDEIVKWLAASKAYRPLNASEGYILSTLNNGENDIWDEGIAFPSRSYEKYIFEKVLQKNPNDVQAKYLYGTLLYGKGLWGEGIQVWEEALRQKADYKIYRNLAVAYYSRDNNYVMALEYMKKAAALSPIDERQITFETAHLMAKVGVAPKKIGDFLLSRDCNRDDIIIELARAYNHQNLPDAALNVLLQRDFVAAEGGEHAIADQYTYAYYLKGKKAYVSGDYENALRHFRNAQILPQSLGSGFWNEVKKIPFQYFEARSLQKMEKDAEAIKIFKSFKKYKFDYFTDMYLYTFAYYAAQALKALGETQEADALIERRQKEFTKARAQKTLGYFGTTPFFISFIDNAERAKNVYYAYPLYLFDCYFKKENSPEKALLETDKYGLYIEDFTL